jgi:predicted nucleotidyltransferase
MSPKLRVDRARLAEFCRRRMITELSFFGSVLRDDFGSDSDVDVLVSFSPKAAWSMFDIVEMIDELKSIFGRDVDLVEEDAIRNPFRRWAILATREVVYAA